MSSTNDFRHMNLGPTDIVVDRRPDGTILVRSPHELGSYAERMTDQLDYWARHASYRTFLAERDAHGRWRNVTYAEAQYFARRIGQALINRDLSVERPVIILSGNDIEHALLLLGAMYAGVPYAPVSPAYSLVSADFAQLKHVMELVTPGLVYASDEAAFAKAVNAAAPRNADVLFGRLSSLEADGAGVANAGPDTIAKFLFTSGSTGKPKAVINTQRMWCSNQEMVRQV